MRKIVLGCGATLVALFVLHPAHASGFSLDAQSAKASGQAGAWVARADDAAANWYNPAALTRLEGTQLQFGISMVDVGDTDFEMNDLQFQNTNGNNGTINGGLIVPPGTHFEAESNEIWPAHFYFSQRINDRWAIGVGVTSPFGFKTEWNDAPVSWSSQRAELVTILVNPNLAFAIGDHASFAIGLDYIYADLQAFSRQVPVQANVPFGVAGDPFEVIGRSNITGTGGDMGYNLAWHYAANEWSMGLSYRSSLDPEIEGNVEFTDFGAFADDFANSPVSSSISLPSNLTVGLAYTGLKSVQFEFDVAWTKWSAFETLAADVHNNTPSVSDVVLNQDWSDTFSARIGANWALNDANHVRFGILFDESPIPTQTLRPVIPDGDRTGYCLGYGFNGSRFQVDAYWMHLAYADTNASGLFVTSPAGPNDGVLDGTYSISSDQFGITAGVKF